MKEKKKKEKLNSFFDGGEFEMEIFLLRFSISTNN